MNWQRIIIRAAIAFCSLLVLFAFQGRPAAHAQGGVDLIISGAPASAIQIGDTFTIVVQAEAGTTPINAAAVYLNFDPSVLNVTAHTPGSSLSSLLLVNTFDNMAGTTGYDAATLGTAPTGTIDLVTIGFQAIAGGTTTISYSLTPRRETSVFTGAGVSALGAAEGIEVTVDTPLAVTLSYFHAQPEGGQVQFDWQTATEAGNAGFDLWAEQAGALTRLNAELIPSPVIDALTPTDYAFRTATDATRFYLDEVGVDGRSKRNGPYALGEVYGAYVDTGTDGESPQGPNSGLILFLPVVTK